MRQKVGLFVISMAVCYLALPTTKHSACAAERRCAEQNWNIFFSTEPSKPYAMYDDKAEWWADLMQKLNQVFRERCERDSFEHALPSLLREFGQHGDLEDLKICLAFPEVFFVQSYGAPAIQGRFPVNTPIGVLRRRRMRELQLLACKVQVEMFLKDPDLFERYYRLLVWSEQFFGRPRYHGLSKVSSLDKHFRKDGEDYWWYARDFLILAHATDADKFVKRDAPTELAAQYARWRKWVNDNVTKLVPHETKPIWQVKPIWHRGRIERLVGGELKPLHQPTEPFDGWNANLEAGRPPVISDMGILISQIKDELPVPCVGSESEYLHRRKLPSCVRCRRSRDFGKRFQLRRRAGIRRSNY